MLGGLGVAIVGDLLAKRGWVRLALETKLVVAMTVLLTVGGMLAFLVFEWSNPATLGAFPEVQRPFNALFESVALRSAGMSTIAVGALTGATLIVAIALMFIGTASGSTGGGIKLTTFSILLATIVSTVLGRPYTAAFGRRVPEVVVYRALSVALLSRRARVRRDAAAGADHRRRRRPAARVRGRVGVRHRRALDRDHALAPGRLAAAS